MIKTANDSVIIVDKEHSAKAIKTLTKAFWNTQPLLYYFSKEEDRKRIAPLLMSLALLPAIKNGEVHASSDKIEGVAVWIPSENYPISLWQILSSVPLSTMFNFARNGGYTLKKFGEYLDTMHVKYVPFKHMYLQSLGVDPEFQGKGHAGKLLSHMTERMDREDMPIYLETAVEQNVGLYKHFGFEVIDTFTVPDTTLNNWAMLRKSQAKKNTT